ncbi:hypothetical protein ES703_51408 [subsurface metagenome]
MAKFNQGLLSDMDVIACWLLSQDTGENFEKLVETRKSQKHEEIIQLEEDVKMLGINKEDFDKQRSIYLLSRENDCSLEMAGEIYEKLEEQRDKRPEGEYARIAESLKTPSYGDVENSKKVEKLTDDGTVEWVHAGTVKLESLKRKYKKGGE